LLRKRESARRKLLKRIEKAAEFIEKGADIYVKA
jgi:hypothetical protein